MVKKKNGFMPVFRAMLVIAFVSASALILVHKITEKPILEAQNRRIADSITSVISSDFDNNPFSEKIIVRLGKERLTLYPARKGGYVTGIAMKSFSSQGFGGRMDVIVGFLMDGTVSGYNVINHSETPGLGSKVNEEAFKQNIIGRNPELENFRVRQDGGEVDAVTGATISSRALIDAIKKASRGYLKFNTGN